MKLSVGKTPSIGMFTGVASVIMVRECEAVKMPGNLWTGVNKSDALLYAHVLGHHMSLKATP